MKIHKKAKHNKADFIVGNIKPILIFLILLVLLPVIVIAGTSVVTFLSKASTIPANIVVDASRSQATLERPWEGLSQGGEQEYPEQLVMLSPVSSHVRELGPRYIRIDHVLEEPFNRDAMARIQEIVSMGATPFISLSYFPRSASSRDVGTVHNWDAWQEAVRSLVEQTSGRSGLNLKGVYYEVWNEPDGENFGNFDIGAGKDYFVLYKKTVEAALSASNVNSFKIGGPGLADLRRCTNGLLFVCQKFWLDQFFNLVTSSKTRMDFVSWHRYSRKVEDFREDVNFILDLQTRYPNLPTSEKVITEWGSEPARNPIHNTVVDAAHLVAASRAFLGHVDLSTRFELRDGPDSGLGGWGILYHNGAKKPTFVALQMLSKLRPERVLLSGEGSNVTGIGSRDSSGVTVILVNYGPHASNVELVPVKIINMNAGRYRLTKSVLNSGSPLGNVKSEEFSSFKGTFSTTETMLPNSIVVYDLQLIDLLP